MSVLGNTVCKCSSCLELHAAIEMHLISVPGDQVQSRQNRLNQLARGLSAELAITAANGRTAPLPPIREGDASCSLGDPQRERKRKCRRKKKKIEAKLKSSRKRAGGRVLVSKMKRASNKMTFCFLMRSTQRSFRP